MERTRSEMEGPWILRIGGVTDTGIILVLVLTGIMIVIIIILTGGVIRDILWMILRNKIHLNSMKI